MQSPFGNAKPREAVIAGRIGKSEEEVLKQEVETVYKLHVRWKMGTRGAGALAVGDWTSLRAAVERS